MQYICCKYIADLLHVQGFKNLLVEQVKMLYYFGAHRPLQAYPQLATQKTESVCVGWSLYKIILNNRKKNYFKMSRFYVKNGTKVLNLYESFLMKITNSID